MQCVLMKIHHLLGKKWSIFILEELIHSPTISFNQLARKMKFITHKILSERLDELEEQGMIIKKKREEQTPKVEYTLTEKGKELRYIFVSMKEWAVKYNVVTETCLERTCTECDKSGLVSDYQP